MSDEDAKKSGEQLQAHLDAMEARDDAARREQTAATLLAALMVETAFRSPLTPADLARVALAVEMTDALRAALKEDS